MSQMDGASDAGGGGGGGTFDPGPAAPPPEVGGGASVAAPPSSVGGGGGCDIDRQVHEIKKRALLRLTLAGARAAERGGGGGGIAARAPTVPAAHMTPAQYAHVYRTGDNLPMSTPNALAGFAGRPHTPGGSRGAIEQHYAPPGHGPSALTTQQELSMRRQQQGTSGSWPPPPPPASPGYGAAANPHLVQSPWTAGMPGGQSLQVASSPLTAVGMQQHPSVVAGGYSGGAAGGYAGSTRRRNTDRVVDMRGDVAGPLSPAAYAQRGGSGVPVAEDRSVRWKRVAQRDTQGELPETVQWIREEVLL
eukprot:Rhum_TRINITY_DN14632_c24_g1::Rhum_TRINITY_DN14632_c24_g1_i1::g.106546::m.106546